MRVKRTNKTPSEVILEIEPTAEEIAPLHAHVLRELAPRARIAGFRPGKAPLPLIEKNLDQQLVFNEFMEHALNSFYNRAAEAEAIRPIATPEVTVKKFVPFSQLVFTAKVEVIGPISLPDYKKLKLTAPKVTVGAKEVDEVIESLRQRGAQRRPVERAAAKGDELIIDFTGADAKGQPIAGADGQNYPLLLGSQTFIPGFEDHLMGAKAGETKQFTTKFPKDYGVGALRGQTVTFKVKVKKVQELAQPAIDDTWAAKVGPFKSVEELKADIKKQLLSEKKWQAARDLENQLIKQIVDGAQLVIPTGLIEDQLQQMEEEERRNLAYRGQTWQEHLSAEGISAEQHRDRHRPDAQARVKTGLVLNEIAEKEDIKVTDAELKDRLQRLKEQHKDPSMRAELDKPTAKRDIASRLMTEKTLAKLIGYATK